MKVNSYYNIKMKSESLIILEKEHELILSVVEKLRFECRELKKGKKINKKLFTKIIDFIKNYADKLHHLKEEDILFKEFENCLEKNSKIGCNPVKQMLYEHDIGRKVIKNLKESVKKEMKDNVIHFSYGYIELISEHIYKEDNILYPMIEDNFDDKTKNKILEKFKKHSKENKNEETKYADFVRGLK